MNDKLRVLLLALREAAIIIIAAAEDFLDIPYDKSALDKRLRKVRP